MGDTAGFVYRLACVSSEIFQKHLNQELLGLPGVKCIAYDVLIYGRDDVNHDRCLEGFIKKCRHKAQPREIGIQV